MNPTSWLSVYRPENTKKVTSHSFQIIVFLSSCMQLIHKLMYCISSIERCLLINAGPPLHAGWLHKCTEINAGSPIHAEVMRERHGKCSKWPHMCFQVGSCKTGQGGHEEKPLLVPTEIIVQWRTRNEVVCVSKEHLIDQVQMTKYGRYVRSMHSTMLAFSYAMHAWTSSLYTTGMKRKMDN